MSRFVWKAHTHTQTNRIPMRYLLVWGEGGGREEGFAGIRSFTGGILAEEKSFKIYK